MLARTMNAAKPSLLDTAPAPAPRIGWPVLRPDGTPLMYYRENDPPRAPRCGEDFIPKDKKRRR